MSKFLTIIGISIILAGCAAHKTQQTVIPTVSATPFWDCPSFDASSCSLSYGYNPAQLTPGGCALYRVGFLRIFGDTAKNAQTCWWIHELLPVWSERSGGDEPGSLPERRFPQRGEWRCLPYSIAHQKWLLMKGGKEAGLSDRFDHNAALTCRKKH